MLPNIFSDSLTRRCTRGVWDCSDRFFNRKIVGEIRNDRGLFSKMWATSDALTSNRIEVRS